MSCLPISLSPYLTSHFILLLFPFSLLTSALHAQNIVYQNDTSCGCDIRYVDGIETIRNDTLYGFRRIDGTVIVPPSYRYVDEFNNGYCRVWLDYGQCGLIDTTGRLLVPCIYDGVSIPSEGRILVAKGNLYGYTDLQGRPVIPPRYINASPFACHRAVVALHETDSLQCLFIDTLGHPLYSDTFQNATPFSFGYAAVMKNRHWGIIDTLGHQIIPLIYSHLSVPNQYTFFAGDANGLSLFHLPDSQPLTPFIYQPVTTLSEGRIGVSHNGKQGFLDTLGRLVIPCIYDEIGLFRHGRAFVRIDTLCGIIDTSGRTILPLQYHNTTPLGDKYVYHDSLALIEQNHHLGYVDLQGNIVIPLQFDKAYHFSNGLAPVYLQGHWGYIDTNGNPYLPFIFDIASPFEHSRAEVYLHGHQHIIDPQGHCVRNCNGIISFR
ncbi:MAG: WG repeat-containing protein [bacterium]